MSAFGDPSLIGALFPLAGSCVHIKPSLYFSRPGISAACRGDSIPFSGFAAHAPIKRHGAVVSGTDVPSAGTRGHAVHIDIELLINSMLTDVIILRVRLPTVCLRVLIEDTGARATMR